MRGGRKTERQTGRERRGGKILWRSSHLSWAGKVMLHTFPPQATQKTVCRSLQRCISSWLLVSPCGLIGAGCTRGCSSCEMWTDRAEWGVSAAAPQILWSWTSAPPASDRHREAAQQWLVESDREEEEEEERERERERERRIVVRVGGCV